MKIRHNINRSYSHFRDYVTVFIDTNVFYNILFETEYVEISQHLLETIPDPVTSYTVVNELIFIVARKAMERKYGVCSYYEFRRVVAEHGYTDVEEYIGKVLDLLKDSNVRIVEDYHNLSEWLEIMKSYRLLPNDAQIALTCRRYGIDTIATFDEDFRRIPWLKVIP